ncbi:MAG TPA: hypothetical protein VFY22_11625 [Hydrogenophaga sp.]|nr:hypothetical protein [Hydrogenophaga sp.]
MRRWLIVIFALQFFCSVSAFAYGQSRIEMALGEVSSILINVADEETKAVQDDPLTLLDAEHNLLDDKPDLPECLGLSWNRLSQADPWDVPLALVSPDRAPPTLAGPQRPPQA